MQMAVTGLFPAAQAQAVALTVAQAFTVAFELWQEAKEGRKLRRSQLETVGFVPVIICCYVLTLLRMLEKGKRAKSGSAGEASSSSHSERSNSLGSLKGTGGTNFQPISLVSFSHMLQNITEHLLRIISHFSVPTILRKGCILIFSSNTPLICQMSPRTTCYTWRTA